MMAADVQHLRTQLSALLEGSDGLHLTAQQSTILLYQLQDIEQRAFALEREIYGEPSLEDIAGYHEIEHGGNVVSITSHTKHPHHNSTGDIAS